MAQFIIDNEPSETDSEPEEANDTTYRRTNNIQILFGDSLGARNLKKKQK